MKSIHKVFLPIVAAAFAFGAATANARPSMTVKDDAMQLKADKDALHRQIERLEADQARLKADTASGRMSAESKDAFEVYQAKEAVKGEKKDISADKAASLQMKADKAALHRQIRRLEVAEARLKADAREGKMAAESRDGEQVYQDRQALKAEKAIIAADKSKLTLDEKK